MQRELIRTLSILLPVLVLAYFSGIDFAVHGVLIAATVFFWQKIFTRYQKRSLGVDWLATTLLFTLLMPADLPWWQLLLAVSFGVVFGEQLFGGRGYSFLHPVIVGVAFLFYSFPAPPMPTDELLPGAVLIPSVLLLLYTRLIDWRVLLSIVAAVALISYLWLHAIPTHLPSSTYLAMLIFAAADPVATTLTRAGRWVHGLLLGSLMILFDPLLHSLHALVFAILLSGMCCPLIDWITIRVRAAKRVNQRA